MSPKTIPPQDLYSPRLKLVQIDSYNKLATVMDILTAPDIFHELFRSGLGKGKLAHHLLHTPGVRSWSIVDSAADLPIGFLMVLDKTPVAGNGHRRAQPVWPEIAYGIHPAARGRGYAFEASKAICNHLILREGAAGVAARVDPGNTGSIRVLEKLGMVPMAKQPGGICMGVRQGQYLVKRVERLVARIDWSKARTGFSRYLANICGIILYLCY